MTVRLLPALLLAACASGSPGYVTVVNEGVGASDGLLLITEARDADGNQAAVLCTSIDADPFDATAQLEAIVGDTPCEDSEPVELAAGTYDLLTATIAGGETEPRACATAQVEVDGDVTVTMPALGACD
jgi:hypothetical protein